MYPLLARMYDVNADSFINGSREVLQRRCNNNLLNYGWDPSNQFWRYHYWYLLELIRNNWLIWVMLMVFDVSIDISLPRIYFKVGHIDPF